MKKWKGILILTTLLLFGGALLLSFRVSPQALYAEDEISGEVIEEEEETSDPMLIDANDNGIPDVLEDYYDQHIRDQYLFGISLGAIVGGLVNIAAAVFIILKNTKTNKEARIVTVNTGKKLEELAKENKLLRLQREEQDKMHEAEKEQYRVTIKELTEITKINVQKYEDASKKLESFSQFDTKLNTIIAVQELLASDPDLVQKGISEAVIKIIKGAK
ncbi:MAG: hypothetical protein M0Q41_10725 [Bacteroidales bacterium]|nr:hypothetical protein [Acholeplasmataceae bacterium]MCK9449435.1 hypothetical protein [Bacteroidales bacterium]